MLGPLSLGSHGIVGDLGTILVVLAGLCLLYPLTLAIYNLYFHPLRAVPGPRLWAASRVPWVLAYVRGRSHRRVLDLHKRYGAVVRVAPDEVAFADPQAWVDIFSRPPGRGDDLENNKDPAFYGCLTSPESILQATPERDHARVRRRVAHGFSAKAMTEQEPLIASYVDLLIARLRENCDGGRAPLDLVRWYNWTTFDIIGDLSFGEPFGCLSRSDYHPWVSMIFDTVKFSTMRVAAVRLPAARRLFSWYFPKDLPRKRAEHVQLATAKVQRRLALGTQRPDFLASMIAEPRDEKDRVSFEEIRGTAQTFIVAGSETTATVLSSVTFYLATHPRVLARLCDEIRSTFRSEDEITFVSCQRLTYMLAVLNEAMRMNPPVPTAFPRRAKKGGAMVCGRYMPEGTLLGIWQWPTYRYPQNFVRPDEFIPERWLEDEGSEFAADRKDAFHPFSFGPRNCVGKNLAYAEMRIILARILWNFDLELDEESRSWEDRLETYQLFHKDPLKVHLTPVKRG